MVELAVVDRGAQQLVVVGEKGKREKGGFSGMVHKEMGREWEGKGKGLIRKWAQQSWVRGKI